MVIVLDNFGVEYYLFKVIGNRLEVFIERIIDDWFCIYRVGVEVFFGNFFVGEIVVFEDYLYKLDIINIKKVIVYVIIVRFICFDF